MFSKAGLFTIGVLQLSSWTHAEVRTIELQARRLAYDAAHGKLFATLPDYVTDGGRLVAIDPVLGTVGPSLVMPNPGKVAISDDGLYAYVAQEFAPVVRRVALGNMSIDLQFGVGGSDFYGPFHVDDLEVMPGNSRAIAISRMKWGYSARSEGVAIYDDGIQRPLATSHIANAIEFGGDASSLYGYNNETSGFDFSTMTITEEGAQVVHSAQGLMSGPYLDFAYGGGKIVSSGGHVIDAVNHCSLGRLSRTGSIAVSRDGSRGFILENRTIYAFDLTTLLAIGSIPVPGPYMGGEELTLWGSNGLAFCGGDHVYLVTSPLIPEPATLLAATAVSPVVARRRRG